ncbi:unnamed protein product [Peniophora sp. CBMAI 1063]|nr:unnamed protein product [Peniophora sp. CBMAI 1063]
MHGFNKFLSVAGAVASLSPLASCAPLRRQTPAVDPNNVLVLQFAQVLNQLEQQFYTQAMAKFSTDDITSAGFTSANLVLEQLTTIASDESSHISALQSTLTSLSQTPLTNCSFDFSSVLTDISTTATLARMVENVGVGAFLGAADLISDPTILTAAASILTVEARHQTILNTLNGGAAIPGAFDLPLLPNEVLAIAGPFLTGSGCELNVTANQPITVTNTDAIVPGTTLSLTSPAINGSTDGLFCQMLQGGMPFSMSLPLSACTVPTGMTGPVAVFVTKDMQPLNNNARDRSAASVLAGPAMIFIDDAPQALSALIKTGGGNSTVISFMTPDQASSVLASASATATATPANDAGAAAATTAAATAATSAAAAEFTPSISLIPKPTATA